jgi:DNA-binding response OmpR family regulator
VPHAIIVENEVALQLILMRSLTLSGYSTTLFPDGDEADAYWQARTEQAANLPDVIILSVHLPDDSGMRFYETLAQTHLPNTLVIIMSSNTHHAELTQALTEGVFVRKPLLPRQLFSLIQRHALKSKAQTTTP